MLMDIVFKHTGPLKMNFFFKFSTCLSQRLCADSTVQQFATFDPKFTSNFTNTVSINQCRKSSDYLEKSSININI